MPVKVTELPVWMITEAGLRVSGSGFTVMMASMWLEALSVEPDRHHVLNAGSIIGHRSPAVTPTGRRSR